MKNRILCLIATILLIASLAPALRAADDFANAPKIEIIMANVTSDNVRDGGHF